MRKILVLLMAVFLFSGILALPADFASAKTVAKATTAKKIIKKKVITASDLIGRLVIADSYDKKFFYVEPTTKERYFLRNQEDLDLVTGKLGKVIPAADFKKLGKTAKTRTPASLVKKYGGKFVASPNATSTFYYLNPADSVAYVVSNYSDFYKAGKVIGVLSPPLAALKGIKMNTIQFTYDPVFDSIAYVKYDGIAFSEGQESARVLPLASLTKVMTALVFLDTNPDWNKIVEITPEEIRYPCTLQTCGSTSEVDLKAGDRVRIGDLWVAMLSASSNQSAKILADSTGLTQEEFVEKMNQKANDLGLVKTKFVEMSGLSPDNISTAEEYAKIARAAFTNYKIAEATRQTEYIFTAEQADGSPRDVLVANRNYSLLAMGPEASKSGYLTEAQRNAAVLKDGKVIVVLHTYSLDQRNQVVKRLLESEQLAVGQ